MVQRRPILTNVIPTGLYLTGQQQIDSVTLEASGREDHDEQFGWHGTWQTATGFRSLLMVIGQRSTHGTGFWHRPLGGTIWRDAFCIFLWAQCAANPNLKPEDRGSGRPKH